MPYYLDLTPYVFFKNKPGLNVGWLDAAHEYPIGDTPPAFVSRLRVLFRDHLTQATRGFQRCSFCREHTADVPRGNAEIAVALDGTTYRAPSLILHYVVDHRYLPPLAFIDAVVRGEPVR